VIFGARHPAAAMLAGDEPSLAVAGVAVGKLRGRAIDRDLAGGLVPAQDAVVGDVAPQETAMVAEPDRSFRPSAAGGETLNRGIEQSIFRKARVEDVDCRVGIA